MTRTPLALAVALTLAACAPGAPADQADGAPAAADADTGWQTLFDGSNLDAWRAYQGDSVPSAWRIEDGALAFVPGSGGGGDIVTREQFDDFELELEWRISPGGNSGVFYRATEEEDYAFMTGAEMQVLDNAGHSDGQSPLTSAGSNFGLYPAVQDATRPVGEWNRARVVARGPHVEHWLNGVKVAEYEQGGEDWRARVAGSKFAAWPKYGQSMRGHIGLQDHGNPVWFRAIRIRPLGDEG